MVEVGKCICGVAGSEAEKVGGAKAVARATFKD